VQLLNNIPKVFNRALQYILLRREILLFMRSFISEGLKFNKSARGNQNLLPCINLSLRGNNLSLIGIDYSLRGSNLSAGQNDLSVRGHDLSFRENNLYTRGNNSSPRGSNLSAGGNNLLILIKNCHPSRKKCLGEFSDLPPP
jgi:hypothetical protein